jgi:hypothetical protein
MPLARIRLIAAGTLQSGPTVTTGEDITSLTRVFSII